MHTTEGVWNWSSQKIYQLFETLTRFDNKKALFWRSKQNQSGRVRVWPEGWSKYKLCTSWGISLYHLLPLCCFRFRCGRPPHNARDKCFILAAFYESLTVCLCSSCRRYYKIVNCSRVTFSSSYSPGFLPCSCFSFCHLGILWTSSLEGKMSGEMRI